MIWLISLLTTLYLPAINVFFSADDWFHLRISQISSLSDFFSFFSFSANAHTAAFYRPLSTQVFFMIFSKVFGLNPIPYHVFVLLSFGFSMWLLSKLMTRLKLDGRTAIVAVLIYGASVSNFTRLYFLSAFQEIAVVIFLLASLIAYLDKKLLTSIVFFVLALLSKETAVVLPIVLVALSLHRKEFKLAKLAPYFLILSIYLYFRLFHFGLAAGDTYIWNLSPGKLINSTIWYTMWSIGAPELLVDYIGSGFRPIPRFFTDFPNWWPAILGFLITTIIILKIAALKNIRATKNNLIYLLLFFVSLLPFIFLPAHKFPLELGFALVWFSIFVATIISKPKKILVVFIAVYLSLNLSMNYLTLGRHYSVGRGSISHRVYQYFLQKYPAAPETGYFEFINDSTAYTKEWGSSRQILNSTGGSELFRVLYADSRYRVYFQDLDEPRPNSIKIGISSYMFLKP